MGTPTAQFSTTPPNESPIQSATSLSEVRSVVAENSDEYIDRLAEAIAITSVSKELDKREKCHLMATKLHEWIEELGGVSEKVLIGFQELEDGTRYDLPPVIMAKFETTSTTKPTLLVYGYYDVEPIMDEKLWDTDPFTLTEDDDGSLIGRGTISNKGPILSWLWCIQTFQQLNRELPVNIKFLFEGMKQSNSECLPDLLSRECRRGAFLSNIDYIVITDNFCLNGSKPCLTYGLRGLAEFEIDVYGGEKNLNSGMFAGTIAEPMTDLIQLLAAISNLGHHDIGVNECGRNSADVRSEAEDALYRGISFDTQRFREDAGNVPALIGGDNVRDVLMNRWRYPALSIHGIEPYTGPGLKTIIPGAVSGKFSIRLVPGQNPEKVELEIRKVLENRFVELKSPNRLTISSSTSKPWLTDPKSTLFTAGAKALLRVHGVRPDLTREGGSIPVVGMLADAIDAEIMLLPLGASDDAAYSENEKFDKRQYLMGVTSLFVLLEEVANAHSRRDDLPPPRSAFSRLRDIWYGLS